MFMGTGTHGVRLAVHLGDMAVNPGIHGGVHNKQSRSNPEYLARHTFARRTWTVTAPRRAAVQIAAQNVQYPAEQKYAAGQENQPDKRIKGISQACRTACTSIRIEGTTCDDVVPAAH